MHVQQAVSADSCVRCKIPSANDMFQRGGGVIVCSQPRPTSKQRFPLICPDPGCQGRRTSVRLFRVKINCRGRADAAMEMEMDVRSRSPRCAYVCACIRKAQYQNTLLMSDQQSYTLTTRPARRQQVVKRPQAADSKRNETKAPL